MKNKPIDERIPAYEILVNNTTADVQIAEKVSPYGYTPEKLDFIRGKISHAKNLVANFKKEYGEQYQATVDYEKLRSESTNYYMRLVKLARIVFVDNVAAYTALSLEGNRKEDYGGWLIQCQTFYNNLLANPAYVKAMSTLNCTEESLLKGKEMLKATVKAKEKQEIERGEAQIATETRNREIEVLDKEMSRMKSVFQVVFEDEPQVLEKLGIVMN